MIPSAASNSSVTHAPVANDSGCSLCTDICVRVQALWNAFLALLSDVIAWFTSSGSASPERERVLARLLEKYESFAGTTQVSTWNGTTIVGRYPIRVGGNTLSYAEKMEKVRKSIEDDHLLFLVANPYYTRAGGNAQDPEANNRTKLLLELGANVNQTERREGHTPLFCAVLTGSFLAYKTLREFGALPVIEINDRMHPGKKISCSYIEIAKGILEGSLEYYFLTLIPLEDTIDAEYKEFIPYEIIKDHTQYLGTNQDIQKMIDFENVRIQHVAKEISQLWQISPSVAHLIAAYNEYY